MSRIVISVDGLAGSGKSSLALGLAERLKFQHFWSGQLYRIVGLLAVKNSIDFADGKRIVEVLKAHSVEAVRSHTGSSAASLDGKVMSIELTSPDVSEAASRVAVLPEVRAYLVALQRESFPGLNIVAEGRDMGTVIFPESALKFFITAPVETRVSRRLSQLGLVGGAADVVAEQLKKEIYERDKRDSERLIAPTKAAGDAIIIDNASQSLTEVIEHMYALATSKLKL